MTVAAVSRAARGLMCLSLTLVGFVGACSSDSNADPYCGLFAEEDVTPIVGRVAEAENEAYGLFSCDIRGEYGTLVAYGTIDSSAAFGQDGNNAMTTMEAITGDEGRAVPGTEARVFSYFDEEHPNAYAYWLEGRAGFTMYTVAAEEVDESTAAALEELVIKYAPQVLDGVASRTEAPGANRNDPATSAPNPDPVVAQTEGSFGEDASTPAGSSGQ